MLFVTLTFILTVSVSAQYILTPKNQNAKVQVNSVDIKQLISVGNIAVYKTSDENYKKNKKKIDESFIVEKEQVYSIKPTIVKSSVTLPWHLARIVRRDLPLQNVYRYSNNGSCHKNSLVKIHTYIVDTGIDITHPEFQNRAEFLQDFSGENDLTDKHSHGTHCAGIVGSKTYGVCKDAKLFAVKVLSSQGWGTTGTVIAGLNYIFTRHLNFEQSNQTVRSIISMSLGGGYSQAMNSVIENMITVNKNIYVVVAAGNSNADACNSSPASAKGVVSVMASDRYDNRAGFSNYGNCTSLYGTGVEVLSTIPGNKVAAYTGTSMAAPEVAGTLNIFIDQFPYLTSKQLIALVLKVSTRNKIINNPGNTANLLSYVYRYDE